MFHETLDVIRSEFTQSQSSDNGSEERVERSKELRGLRNRNEITITNLCVCVCVCVCVRSWNTNVVLRRNLTVVKIEVEK